MLIAGRYEIEAEVGRGGMGRVYKAHDRNMDRRVALKLLSADLAADDTALRRFERESAATSRLEHPNTVRVYDFGRTPDGQLFLVMELLDGHTLARAIADAGGGLAIERVVHIAAQIARGLVAAHANGIVHRDLKPGNIMLRDLYGESDFVTILDFGIAELQGASRLTRSGFVAASAPYASPEQANGQPSGPRGDLYTLGVVIYECLTGHLPFEADNQMGYLYAHVYKQAERPSTLRSDVPAWLDDLVMRLLAKHPDARYPDAASVVQLLSPGRLTVPPGSFGAMPGQPREVLPDTTVAPAPAVSTVMPRARPRWAWIAGAVVLVGAGAAGIAALTGGDRPTGSTFGTLTAAVATAADASATEPTTVETDAGPTVTEVSASLDVTDATQAEADTPTSANDTRDADAPETTRVRRPLTLSVTSSPDGAEIFLGTTSKGRTPTTLTFREGDPVHLTFRLDGYRNGAWSGKWGKPKAINVSLKEI